MEDSDNLIATAIFQFYNDRSSIYFVVSTDRTKMMQLHQQSYKQLKQLVIATKLNFNSSIRIKFINFNKP
jgi:hypothetical protein